MIRKNFLKILIISTLFVPVASAQNMMPPSLLDVMKQNEIKAIEQSQKISTTEKPSENISEKEIELTYRNIFEGNAIKISRANEAMLWVQEIDLSKWAKVDSHLEVVSYNSETGEPQYAKKSITEALSSLENKPTSLINGQFFAPKMNPSEISFGLKQGEIVRSAGADNRSYAKNVLRIYDSIAEIVPYSWKNLENSPNGFAMVNLKISNNRYAKEKIGRTYMCLKNPNAKNRSSVVLTFTATDMTEAEAEKEMLKWGCTKESSSQLDGSGSSRIWYEDNFVFGASHKGEQDKRKIPHYILFFDAQK